jgi:hypothetical protein
MRRRDLLSALAGAVVVLALAGSVAWAAIPGDGGVYTACMLKNVGTVRLIDKSLPPGNLMSRCKPALEIEVSWNQKGQQGIQGSPGTNGTNGQDGQDGADGASVTSELEPAGANCTNGGSKFTAANGVTYACNGADGAGSGAATVCDRLALAPAHDVAGCSIVRVPARNGGPDEDVTISSFTGGSVGQVVTVTPYCVPFCNITQRAILDDGAQLVLAGDAVVFPSDTVQLINMGSFWLELGRSKNCEICHP